eukprot:TRINITY_DN12046_c0_g1_i1.p1 TRINITY_DN12046_c0_g1~~TRINITY_DN12046_c0_g1_i1.p1  ORF type:complete len:963 (-),score=208.55 TRINITY_DN12046_c0_g1_i1:1442-4165(-)
MAIVTRAVASNVFITAACSDSSVALLDVTSAVILQSDVFKPSTFTLTGLRDYIDRADIRYSVAFTAAGISVSQTATIELWNTNVDVAGFNISRTQLSVNETGTKDTFTVIPTSKHLTTLQMSVQSANATIATVGVNAVDMLSQVTLTWAAMTWPPVAQAVTVTGMRFPDDTDTTAIRNVVVLMSAISGDANYLALAPRNVSVLSADVHGPLPLSIVPALLSQVGLAVTVTGDFLPGVQAWLGIQPCVNLTVITQTARTAVINMVTPGLNATGNFTQGVYVNMTFLNPDGGFYLWREPVFVTASCPYEGQFGIGLACRNCPAGAVCPGGFRVWPIAGFWSNGETDPTVSACVPAAACLGGRFASCATGYEGAICAQCSSQFFRSRDYTCEPCSGTDLQAMLLTLQMSFLAVFIVVAAFVSDDTLSDAAFVVSNLRGLWVCTAGLQELPSLVTKILSILSLLAADMNFSQPGCSGISTFAGVWGFNMAAVIAAWALLCGILLLQYRIKRAQIGLGTATTADVEGKYAADSENERSDIAQAATEMKTTFVIHAARVNFCFMMLVFAVVYMKAVQAFQCVDDGTGALVLLFDSAVTCFQGPHTAIFIASVVFLLACVALLAFSTYFSLKARSKPLHSWQVGVAIASMDDFHGRWQTYFNLVLCIVDMALGFVQQFVLDPGWLFIGKMIILGLSLIVIVLTRPFADRWKFISYIMINLASMLATIYPWLTSGKDVVAYVMVSLMLGYFLLILVVILHECSSRLRRKTMPQLLSKSAVSDVAREDSNTFVMELLLLQDSMRFGTSAAKLFKKQSTVSAASYHSARSVNFDEDVSSTEGGGDSFSRRSSVKRVGPEEASSIHSVGSVAVAWQETALLPITVDSTAYSGDDDSALVQQQQQHTQPMPQHVHTTLG